METIYKWTLAMQDRQEIEVPKGSRFLTVQTQHGEPEVWGICDPEKEKVVQVVHMLGTGHQMLKEKNLVYLNSFQMDNGRFVFHVFMEV